MASTAALRMRFDGFELDEADVRLRRGDKVIPLPPKAFGVLCTLARQPGMLVTKNALLDAVWGHQHVSESVLKTIISQLRAALDDDASRPRYIETASRLGYRFIAAPAAATPHATTAEVAHAGPITSEQFIGRAAPLARLRGSWQRAREGQRQLVWIAGDAGVGKSTLLDQFARHSGATAIAQGQCIEQYGSGEPYLPVLQALGDLCREYPHLVETMRAVAPTWLLQLPWLQPEAARANLARELAGVSPERMVREFQELITRFAERQPLLFLVEDLHWCDPATLRLMDHFARQRSTARVLWACTFRLAQVIAEEHPLQDLRRELRLHKLCEEITLDPFSEAEVQDFLRSRAPRDEASETFIRRVHMHTDGLPLFVANVVEALLAAEPDDAGAAHASLSTANPLPVPIDLMDAVEARIGKLPADIVAMLEAAAICGVEFRAGNLAALINRPYAQVLDACDLLVRQQHWLRHTATVDLADGSLDSLYSFRHAIYRHVFYHRMGATQRIQLHRRLAQLLVEGAAKGLPPAPAELASHHERGRETGPALAAYASAAQAALRSFAPQTARETCEHALTLLAQLPAGPEKLALELGIESARNIAVAQLHGVGSVPARAIAERVHELCNLLPQHPARALLLNAYGASLYSRGEYMKMLELADRLDRLEGPDRLSLSVMTCLFRGGATAARGECRVATAWWRQAIAHCEAVTDRSNFHAFIMDPEVAIRANAARTFFEHGLIDQAREHCAKAVAQAAALGQPLAQSLAHWRAGMLEIRLGHPHKVIEHADAIQAVVAKTSVSQGDGPSRYLRGWAMAQLGDPRQGVELIRDGLARHLHIGMISNSSEVLGYAAEALILARDWDAAEAQLAEAHARVRELDEQVSMPMLLVVESRLAVGRGDAARAHRHLQEAVQLAQSQEAPGLELKAACELVAHPACTAADRAALASLLERITEGRDTRDYLKGRALLA